MKNIPLSQSAAPFLDDLEAWLERLPAEDLSTIAPNPQRAALVSVDVIEGFCTTGVLASPRVGNIVPPIVQLFQLVWDQGVRQILLVQDTHEPDAVEFSAWPVHCVRGSAEAQTVAPIQALPFFSQITVQEKNSIHSGLNTGLADWLAQRPELDTFIIVGDCTDLCTYQLAMHLRLDANARQLPRRVIVPVDCVQTYDRPLEAAREQGGFAHPGDLLHAVFLYHMALNGIEVVRKIV